MVQLPAVQILTAPRLHNINIAQSSTESAAQKLLVEEVKHVLREASRVVHHAKVPAFAHTEFSTRDLRSNPWYRSFKLTFLCTYTEGGHPDTWQNLPEVTWHGVEH